MEELSEFTKDFFGFKHEFYIEINENMFYDPMKESNIKIIVGWVLTSFLLFLNENKIEYTIDKIENVGTREKIRMTSSFITPDEIMDLLPKKSKDVEYEISILVQTKKLIYEGHKIAWNFTNGLFKEIYE